MRVDDPVRGMRDAFNGRPGQIYAVIDAALVADFQQKLDAAQIPSLCLFAGNDAITLAESAPYLLPLDVTRDATHSLWRAAIGQNWGIHLRSARSPEGLRTHLRRLLWIRHFSSEDPVYFRFYDPRVLRSFLPTCDHPQLRTLFGDSVIDAFYAEDARASSLLEYTRMPQTAIGRAVADVPIELHVWPLSNGKRNHGDP